MERTLQNRKQMDAMKPPIANLKKSLLCLFWLMLLWLMPQRAVADDMNVNWISVDMSTLGTEGYFTVKLPVYDDNKEDEWIDDPSYVYVNDQQAVYINSWNQGEGDKYDAHFRLHSGACYAEVVHRDGTTPIPTGTVTGNLPFTKSDNTSMATIRIWPTADILKSGDVKVYVDFYYEGNGSSGDHYKTTITSATYTLPTAPALNWSYSTNAGKQQVTFNGSTGDKYTITGKSQTTITKDGQVAVEYDIQNTARTVSMTYYKKVSEYQTIDVNAGSITIPAYQHPSQLNVEQQSNGNVKLSWTISGSGDHVKGDNFELQRSKDKGFAVSETVGTLAFDGQKTYSLIDEVSKLNLNGTYYYRLRRTAAAQWNWNYTKNASINLSMAHKKVSTVTAAMENGQVRLRWTYDNGNVWSENSEVIVERTNVTKSTSETFPVPNATSSTTTYLDRLPTTCDVYTYKLHVKPGLSVYPTQSGVLATSDGNLYTVEMGSVTSFTASKGYYIERVALEWETDGKSIDLFSIRAREYGSNDDWKQIDQVEANVASTTYRYDDTKSVPGVIYEYQVVAVAACGGENVQMPYEKNEIGFRTPTGDIYGRVTFENGQAVPDVEVRAEITEGSGISGKAYLFDGDDNLTVANTSLLKNATAEATIEAWVRLEGEGTIVKKQDMYELAYDGSKITFKVGTQTVTSNSAVSAYTSSTSYLHVSAVAATDFIYLYLNGIEEAKVARTATPTGNDNSLQMGSDGYKGGIDEVRIWTVALDSASVVRDYGRYLVGNETGLAAYYTFDYSVGSNFYDTSYSGSKYNQNHGTVTGATLSNTDIPTISQLGHKGYTAADGSYAIRALPYTGNGTTYMIIPRLGIHQFESEKELRLLNGQAQSHTVNFTDKSSFKVSGKVTYKGGSVPVEGVSFKVDGVTAMDGKGNILQTDAKGMFEINVPVGQHEVKAEKSNHVFELDGRITDNNLQDRNYQDVLTGVELYDITTVRYIGRVAGGYEQEEVVLGHSLSKNNLADGVTVTLTYQNDSYMMTNDPARPTEAGTREETLTHFNAGYTNKVVYNGNSIIIYPNAKTGEFVADVIPENYKVMVNVPGHGEIPGSGEQLNLSNCFATDFSTWETVDETTGLVKNDTVKFNKKQLFIKRYTPIIDVKQLVKNAEVDYFGVKEYQHTAFNSTATNVIDCYDEATGNYLIAGYPVFEQGSSVKLALRVYEEYIYKTETGDVKSGVESDKVPTTDAKLKFNQSDLIYQPSDEALDVDSIDASLVYEFQVNNPILAVGADAQNNLRTLAINMTYGDANNPTSVNWREGGLKAIVLGALQEGTNFVTKGPDKVLFVLRDPPGSNSYAYLEKGTTVTSVDSYIGSVSNEGDVFTTLSSGAQTMTFVGIGAGTINNFEYKNEVNVGLTHSQTIGGTDTKTSVSTTTTRIQTSAAPDYVGANADLYVGYSTNVSVGKTNTVSLVKKEYYDADPTSYEVFENITPIGSPYLLAKGIGVSFSQDYSTMFVYPQIHIEEVLIPELKKIKESLLIQPVEGEDYQALANRENRAIYVSKLSPDHEHYGKSNQDETAFPKLGADIYDGKSYKVYFPETSELSLRNDTILSLNQSIDNWIELMKQNEMDKVNAKLKQNYSFQGGSSVEYAESYSYEFSRIAGFSLCIGAEVMSTFGVNVSGTGAIMNINDNLKTEHGGEFTDANEGNQAKGFVLEDEGMDYISVDVCEPKGWWNGSEYVDYDDHLNKDEVNSKEQNFSTFIFKTKGGVTSCPYESGYKTKYFEPGQHVIDEATVQVEVPEISIENSFIENVPSGKPAYFTLYLRNNSEVQLDNWFDLMIDDSSNPDGAQLLIDGAPIGNGRAFLVPAGETLTKTLEVRKGSVMNYDNLRLTLQSQCQCSAADYNADIFDDVTFTVHFTPSATDVNIKKPSNNWTYNTALPTELVNGVKKHYMEVQLDGFDVNYDNFHRIMLQYKPASGSDDDWTTLMNYYNEQTLYDQAVANGMNATMIKAADAGTITYKLFLDDLQDQHYNLRAVGTSMINNVEYQNASDVYAGIKDMYNPRLFGSAQPANGVLTINDEIRLNFNETIAEGYLTDNNFQVTGVRNGAQTGHDVSVYLDGKNDMLTSDFNRNWANKDLTIEMWVLADEEQNAVFFSHGNVSKSLELGITKSNLLKVKVGSMTIESKKKVPYEQGTWAHVALVYSKNGKVSAYYNYEEFISNESVPVYDASGTYRFGADSKGNNFFAGKIHNARIWDKVQTSGRLQTNSMTQLSGAESNLLAYYPMDEAKGTVLKDKARGVNLAMNSSEWALPEGRAVAFNGKDQYVKLTTGAAVVDYLMDYTIEFWFKGAAGQKNATLAANGRGDGKELGGSRDLFCLGFENGVLTFRNNGVVATAEGNYLDDNWHHIALAVSRTNGRGQILIDGALKSYFESQDLGGVSAANLYLGARGWVADGNDVTALTIDNYFKGEIDEFRMWNLYKNETLIENGSTQGLDGTEMGLLAYYPFQHYIEWQGTKELQFTLKDMLVKDDAEEATADAVAVGGNLETKQAAPVRDKGPVSKLGYNFVVNNDALIITLDETWERIEKTIVTFTVDGVRDLNGNKLLNPITWSAYIDRNQLKWSESEVSIQKDTDVEKSFTVKAVNNGGSVQHFTLENMPSWLDVEPASGTISPLSSIDIKFTIDAGLNIGSYDEVVYMRNDNNVVEALPIAVKVNAEKPNWTVNPADFEYSMSVFGKLLVDEIYSKDEEDMLAVFNGGQCVGVVNNSYSKANDMYYALLTVYSNEAQGGGNLEFRIWDASTGVTYQATPDREITFSNNAIIGTSTEPVIFETEEICIQRIALQTGWNWISFNVEDANLNDLNKLLANNSWTINDVVKSESGSGNASYTKNGWVGTLTGFDNKDMYLVLSSEDQMLDVTGTLVDPLKQKLDIVGTMSNGTKRWNYISYLPSINLPLKEALAGYDAQEGDVVKTQNGFAMYTGNVGWIGSLSYMESGKGYMLQRNAKTNATLQYPSTATTRNVATRTEAPQAVEGYVNNNYAGNMTVVAKLTGVEVNVGDRLAAYVDGELRGEAVVTVVPELEDNLFFLTVAGDAEENVDVALIADGEVKGTVKGAMDYMNNQMRGSVANPMLIDFKNETTIASVFPSPFTDVLNIRMNVDADAVVRITITDVQGMTVANMADCNNNGVVDVVWKDAARLTPGVYVVIITVNDKPNAYKVVKK